jgi:hypothetical protein
MKSEIKKILKEKCKLDIYTDKISLVNKLNYIVKCFVNFKHIIIFVQTFNI